MTAPRVGDIFRRADWHAADRGAGMGGTKGPIHLLKRKPLRDLSHGFPNRAAALLSSHSGRANICATRRGRVFMVSRLDSLAAFRWSQGLGGLTAVAAVAVVTLVMAVWWLAALLLRWRFQFGIRTLLVLSVSVAVPCGWIGAEAEHARRQRQVVQEIEAKGGWLRYDYQFYPSGTLGLRLRPPGPAWLQCGAREGLLRERGKGVA